MPTNVKTFTVRGRGPFPMDMLRYDSAWPAETHDANMIAATQHPDWSGLWDIKIYTADRFSPTVARWESFGCRVNH